MECYTAHYCFKNPVKDLEDSGFETNEYDSCVANKTVNGSQMTVSCHVDNLKSSHKEIFEINRFLKYLQDIYLGLQTSCGKVHYYLGMTLDYFKKGKIQVLTIPHLINLLKEFPEEIGSPASITAPYHLCKL